MITCKPIFSPRLATMMHPALGVVPPSSKLSHNSTRSAPPLSAANAPEAESTQISTRIMRAIVIKPEVGGSFLLWRRSQSDSGCRKDLKQAAKEARLNRISPKAQAGGGRPGLRDARGLLT